MESFIGKKFYLSEACIDFPYPSDIRILEENDDSVLIKNGSRKIIIDKETLHKYYTMLTPQLVFTIRFLTDADLRDSIVLTVNSYKPSITSYGNVVYFQEADLLKLYMEYKIDGKFASHKYSSNITSEKLDDEHTLRVSKDKYHNLYNNYYKERKSVVYGYREDSLRDLIKFIPRKKWLNTIKYAFNCINSIYDYGIESDTRSLIKFFKELQKDYSASIDTNYIVDILPDSLLKESKGDKVLQILVNLMLTGSMKQRKFSSQEIELLTALLQFDHGIRRGKIADISKIDLSSIKVRNYKDTDNIEDMKSNNPNIYYKLIRITSTNDLYIVSFKEKPIVQQVLSGENKALSDEELNKFLTKKTVN